MVDFSLVDTQAKKEFWYAPARARISVSQRIELEGMRGWYNLNLHEPSVETLHIYSICWAGGESREYRKALTAALSFFIFTGAQFS